MNKVFKISSLLLSGVVVGAVAGRIATNEILVRSKRSNFAKSIRSVKGFWRKSDNKDLDNLDQYFI